MSKLTSTDFWLGVCAGCTAAATYSSLRRWWGHRGAGHAGGAKVPTVVLGNDVQMPMLGLGTASFIDGLRRPEETSRFLPLALDAGYRMFDTARMYGNERHIGEVIRRYMSEGKMTREELFIVTKVAHPPTADYPDAKTGYLNATAATAETEKAAREGVVRECLESLEALGVGYVDLLLLHWPGMIQETKRYIKGEPPPPNNVAVNARIRRGMWQGMEEIYRRGLARAIGVSNFTRGHLDSMLPGCDVWPMVNQLEVHPYLPQEELVEYCQGKGIKVMAFSPLAAGTLNVLYDPVLQQLARQRRIPVSELVLTWLLQRGVAAIPKSTSAERMSANLAAGRVRLSDKDMRVISTLPTRSRVCNDPSLID